MQQSKASHSQEALEALNLSAHGSPILSSELQLPGSTREIAAAVINISSSHEVDPSVGLAGLPKDIIAIIDVSGSMGGVMADVRQTANQIAASLQPHDRMAIVSFSTQAKIEMSMCASSDAKQDIEKVSSRLKADASTNIAAAITCAIDVAKNAPFVGRRLTLMLLLSDGCPNVGLSSTTDLVLHSRKLVAALNNLPHVPLMVFHSFGYTLGHQAELLRALTETGNAGSGAYYFLRQPQDIGSAIGDCLGRTTSVVAYAVRLEAFALDRTCQHQLPNTRCSAYLGTASSLSADSSAVLIHPIGYLGAAEKRNVVLYCLSASATKGEAEETIGAIMIRLHYTDARTGQEKSQSLITPIVSLAADAPNPFRLHLLTHILRLRIAKLLPQIGQRNASVGVEVFEDVHENLLRVLTAIQAIESSDQEVQTLMRVDEQILQTLERDLGDALERLNDNDLSSADQYRLIQFGHEHSQQQSASCATELRPTYSTPAQEAMRNQFSKNVTSNKPNDIEKEIEDAAVKEKAALLLAEGDLVEAEIAKRRAVDAEALCFVTLENWRAAHVGIGLLVAPRTMRERYRRLIPQIELTNDYVSSSAFNSGARAFFTTHGNVDRDLDHNGKFTVMTSSLCGRINAWLPLYINATNWNYARRFAPDAFSIIATQVNDKFKPIHAVQVCAKLLCQCVVRFVDGTLHFSERAVQQYCDIHRLFLAMVFEYPQIRTVARDGLQAFVEKTWVRGRELTPDIGTLIQYLAVTDSFSWNDFKEAYLRESFRRNARWIKKRFEEKLRAGLPENDAELVELWFEGGKVSTGLMLFNVAFLEIVARPAGKTMQEVTEMYDRLWGRLDDVRLNALQKAFSEIRAVKTLSDVMARIGMPTEVEEIAKLIRWAWANQAEVSVPTELKHAPASAVNSATYSRFLISRSQRNDIYKLSEESEKLANVRCGQLAQIFTTACSSASVPSASSSLLVCQSVPALLQINDGPMAEVRRLKVDVEMVHCAKADHSVPGRAVGLSMPMGSCMKEMFFRITNPASGEFEYVLVISAGVADVSTGTLRSALQLPVGCSIGLAPSVSQCIKYPASCIPPTAGCDLHPNVKVRTVINACSLPSGDPETTFVFTSAGARGFFFRISIENLRKLLPQAEFLNC